ncbi:hypothetical protein DYB30_004878 [Aphanomyces astaci]|uniref:PHD-type domain-containing protein n=1 Tax=Aphanomyces astaci TaxID=112090 RepID=A0A397D862_APHAT|nr:hypothetical protein DYB30_004878 [Aphanomyces astaci]
MALDDAIQCPTCLAQFPLRDDAFPVHMATCAPGGTIDAEYKSCLICFKVFGPNVPSYEILFHRDECERVNGPPPKRAGAQKRRRGSDADKSLSVLSNSSSLSSRAPSSHHPTPPSSLTSDLTPDSQTLNCTPTLCFLCGQGGRQLVVCTSKCSRAFHVGCIGETAALTQRQGLGARRVWQCAECSRNVHTCFSCGFLGDDGIDMFPCSMAGCGLYCHDRCMPQPVVDAAAFECRRHRCQECSMPSAAPALPSDCIQCYKCATMVHKSCENGKPLPSFSNVAGVYGDCGRHAAAFPPPAHFKAKLALQDIVLVLELANYVLSVGAKGFKGNQWGRVVRVESVDGGAQLLSVLLFACGSVICVPGHCLLRLGRQYALTVL